MLGGMNRPRLLTYYLLTALLLALVPGPAWAAGGSFPMLEASFELPQVQGNPFDFTQNDVKVSVTTPDGTSVSLPAFFDGGQTWRARYTPSAAGKVSFGAITLNGQDANPQNVSARDIVVTGEPKPGFVRIDPKDSMRFSFDDGTPYYPVGYDLGWRNGGEPPLPQTLAKMGLAGVNWSRIWMCHWDAKNLDWTEDASQQPKLGELSLPVARLWDQIVTAADEGGVYFHLVLQHHGQYSTGADANWQENPWNKANGGWLESPVEFFTDPKAIALTKSKFRYIIARWSYSPAIMAWELFNEVENTDAFTKDVDAVAAWHVEMAKFIREQDPYHHLITTSSRLSEPKLWTAVDYYDAHIYPPDVVAAMASLEAEHLTKPYFYGEIGGSENGGSSDGAQTLHRILWSGLMSSASGGAQYWFWDIVGRDHLLGQFTVTQDFIAQSGLLSQADLHSTEVGVQTPNLVPLTFGAGAGWSAAKQTDYTVRPSGYVEGLGGLSAYLQGNGNNHDMFPYAVFNVDYPVDGTFSIRMDQMTAQGADLRVKLDGKDVVRLTLSAPPPPFRQRPGAAAQPGPRRDPRLDQALELCVPAGPHVIRLDNTGADWLHIRNFTLAPYAPQLAVYAKANHHFAAMWISRRQTDSDASPVSGKLSIPGLDGGDYQVSWWDTATGKVTGTQTATVTAGAPLTLDTPTVRQDIAGWIAPAGNH
jgi:hypothetical protein